MASFCCALIHAAERGPTAFILDALRYAMINRRELQPATVHETPVAESMACAAGTQ